MLSIIQDWPLSLGKLSRHLQPYTQEETGGERQGRSDPKPPRAGPFTNFSREQQEVSGQALADLGADTDTHGSPGYRQTETHTHTHTHVMPLPVPGCAGLGHDHEGLVPWQGHTRMPSHPSPRQGSRMVSFPPKRQKIPMKSIEMLLPFRMQRNSNAPPGMDGCWQMTWGWSVSHHGWRKQRGKQSVLYGAGPGAPGLGDPSSVLVGSREEILKFEFKCCFFCDRGEVRAREGRAPLPGSPQPSRKKPCLAQGRRMVQRTTGEIEEGVRLGPCQPLAQERGWTQPGEAVSLGTHSWMEHPAFHGGWIVQGHPLQDCPSSMG